MVLEHTQLGEIGLKKFSGLISFAIRKKKIKKIPQHMGFFFGF